MNACMRSCINEISPQSMILHVSLCTCAKQAKTSTISPISSSSSSYLPENSLDDTPDMLKVFASEILTVGHVKLEGVDHVMQRYKWIVDGSHLFEKERVMPD